jgi:hypothetical protein
MWLTFIKIYIGAGCWKLTPVILATWEMKIEKIKVPDQPGQIIQHLVSKNNQSKVDWRCSNPSSSPKKKVDKNPNYLLL